ncbi:3,4-dihydroxy-2-butanone-4-phosphate synthase [Pelomonas sp. CA6]|uniref:3,4-dihydroxy-2-butanone-4-phosphate synthase n=1 Tax=Pelomonas sp. CA6 TaxID=2907999 RepID=UPI0027E03A42|nr:3,4-dihydroxy-2-butanone-4-phosphate synthase [Pelomonas sp. CA6]
MSQTQIAERAAPAYPCSDSAVEAARRRIQPALEAMRQGIPVVLMDDDDRENEADLILAAERITEQTMAQLIRDGSGIVCLCMTDEDLSRLQLPQMVARNESSHGTAFTVSIEARHGVSTGVSARDRLTTVRAAIHPQARPEDLVRPGHVFPLRAHPGGVLARPGHTEGSVLLSRLAGLRPSAVLCELMNPDGTMTRGAQVLDYARRHGLPVLTIADLVLSERQECGEG